MDSLATLPKALVWNHPKALVHPNRAPRPLLSSACDLFQGFFRALGNRALLTVPSPLSPSACPKLIQSSLVTRSYESQQWGTSLMFFATLGILFMLPSASLGDATISLTSIAWRDGTPLDQLCVQLMAPLSHTAKHSAVAGEGPCSVHWPGACSPDSAQM